MKTSVAMPSSDKRVRVGGIGGMVDQILLRLLTERSNVDDLLSTAALNCRYQAISSNGGKCRAAIEHGSMVTTLPLR